MRVLLQARARGHALGRDAVRQIVASLREDAKRLEVVDASGVMTAERARVIRAQALGLINALEQATVGATRNAVRLTVRDIVGMHSALNERLFREYGKDTKLLAGAFDSIDVRVLSAIGSRSRNAATFRTLVNRHMEEAVPALDRLLTSSIARGVSVKKLTGDVASVLKGNSPDLSPYEMPDTALGGMRSLTADSRMIALSETNNAMREATRQSMAASTIVAAAKWQTSGNHDTGCECDDIAAEDVGYGPGYYPMDSWPEAPHPNCACYAGDVQFNPISSWGGDDSGDEQ